MEKQNNIMDELIYRMQTDDQCTETTSERLNTIYFKKASEAERKLIDGLFISLCGWSFETLHIYTTDINKRLFLEKLQLEPAIDEEGRAKRIKLYKDREAKGDYDAIRRSWNQYHSQIIAMTIEEKAAGTSWDVIEKKINRMYYNFGFNLPTDSQKRAAGITSKIKEAFIKMAEEDEFPLDLSDGVLYAKIETIIEAYDKPIET